MFNYAFNVHGYWLGRNYKPGEWTRWQVMSKEEKHTHEMEKAYLKKEADGKEWWCVAYVDNGDGATFEGQFAAGLAEMLRLHGRFSANEQPTEFPVTKGKVYQRPNMWRLPA